MALEAIYARLPAEAGTLLRRLPAYREPVPAEGILKLALDLPNAETLLERLLAVSLLEVSYQPDWEALEYALPPLVSEWLDSKNLADNAPEWRSAAADYHLFLRQHERRTLPQAITAHHALRRADRHTEVKQSLTIRQQIGDKAGEGATLNNISQIYDAQGDYETALDYLKQSLTIRQQIGDKAGRGDAQQYFANFQSAGRLRDGARLPETVADDQAANRRQSGDPRAE
jgi:tetratricopeptide (TPR) repeat protein